jgi:hypothetical protein
MRAGVLRIRPPERVTASRAPGMLRSGLASAVGEAWTHGWLGKPFQAQPNPWRIKRIPVHGNQIPCSRL